MLFNAFTHHLSQQICHALGGLDSGDHEQVSVHLRPVDVISRAADELCQEGTLGTAITLAERVEVIGGAIKIHDLVCKGIVGQTSKVILILQTIENQNGASFDFF